MNYKREFIFIGLASALVALVFANLGMAYGLRMLTEIACFTIIALGLTIQWGYAGLFNAGIMGFIALSAFVSMLVSYPVNAAFWDSPDAVRLAGVFARLIIGIGIIWGINKLPALQSRIKLRRLLVLVAIATTYLVFMHSLSPVATSIEKTAGFVGGFGLPVWLGWIAGGIVAGVLAWFVGHICLGLRSDYLAIATLGIAEIVKAILKNEEKSALLTRAHCIWRSLPS
jgi:branched-chain amino acid transport system permease protein